MEVEKQPSPWPCVLMLAALLLCCLAAPRYWQRDLTTDNDHTTTTDFGRGRTATANSANPFDLSSAKFGTLGNGPSSDVLSLWAPPSIEELLAARSNYGQHETTGFGTSGSWSDPMGFSSQNNLNSFNGTFQTDTSIYQSTTTPVIDPDSPATTALEAIGAAMAEGSPAQVAAELFARVVDAIPFDQLDDSTLPTGPNTGFASRSTLQLVHPGDRLAMIPAPPKATSWCVPQTLFDEVERLAEYPYTAFWASHVGNQLHALTERDQLEGDDVQSILADLGDAAQEALRMADGTDDDRMRVELLRVHWALARRLDCWAAMHEQRVAFNFQGRVAARGDLSPYFDSTPSNSPTPADIAELSRQIEQYEKSCDPRLGRQIVGQQRLLAQSSASFDRSLADSVEQHYRNANIRIAITAQMVNRMMASERSESRPVRESIAGAFVQGQSDIYSKSSVQLAPAENEWQMKVQANGVVESNTLADAGPVRLRSRGETGFIGTKSVIVRPDGVHMQPSDVTTNYSNQLMGVTTDYDWVPMFGNVTRDRAVDQYRAKQGFVRGVTEMRVSSETGDTLDRDTHEALERVRQRVYARFTKHFDEYGLKLTTVEMKSTPERLVARVRVAGDDQLGSHTPRPRALSDSLASVQLHETALNNLAITLGLDGKRYTGEELQAKMHERFPQMAQKDPQEIRRDTVFQFAPKDAVQVHIADGKLELKILFDSVELDGESMPNVIVHAKYVPAVEGLNADLARDGALGIEGQLSPSERARLHNIFKTVFPPERKLRLAHLNEEQDKRLEGLMITQLVLEDGWIGVAIGPESSNRVAERSRSLR